MIKSMTGFGRCEITDGERKFTVELKGVNHRYLDVNIRMPKKLNFFETAIRNLLKQYAQRGKVDIFITYEDTSENQVSLKYNPVLAEEYLTYFKEMKETFEFIANYEGEIPGATAKDCGNYLLQDLPMARWEAKKYLTEVLSNLQQENLCYPN